MKIVFAGGGTGGHFYPIIAIAEEIHKIVEEEKLVKPKLYFVAPTPYDEKALFENDIIFRRTIAGKMRRYRSAKNIFDFFKTGWGVIGAILTLFTIYPDIVFAKGGYVSFPTLVAARILRIPVFIHESDSVPGRVNKWAADFAKRIAVSYPDTAEEFPDQEKVALIGTPVRSTIRDPATEGAHEYLNLDPNVPTVLVLGGSQGAQRINETLLSALPDLVQKYQIIHQVGEKNYEELSRTAGVVLEGNQFRNRYKPFGYLDDLALRMSAGASQLVVSRAGSTIFEIAMWGRPAILIPLPDAVDANGHQRKNAFAYARAGAGSVLSQANLTPHLLAAEIERIIGDPAIQKEMIEASQIFRRPDAGRKIAEEIVEIALTHEK